MPKNLIPKSIPVNVVEAVCDRCQHLRSKRGAMVVQVRGCEKFVCAACAASFQNHFGVSREEREATYKMLSELGGAA